jgi:hypothetical protein
MQAYSKREFWKLVSQRLDASILGWFYTRMHKPHHTSFKPAVSYCLQIRLEYIKVYMNMCVYQLHRHSLLSLSWICDIDVIYSSIFSVGVLLFCCEATSQIINVFLEHLVLKTDSAELIAPQGRE